MREVENMRFQDALNRIAERQLATVDRLYSSEDQIEGTKAFAEKRYRLARPLVPVSL